MHFLHANIPEHPVSVDDRDVAFVPFVKESDGSTFSPEVETICPLVITLAPTILQRIQLQFHSCSEIHLAAVKYSITFFKPNQTCETLLKAFLKILQGTFLLENEFIIENETRLLETSDI